MGSSKSSQATSMQDNRRVLGEGSISAEGGSVVTVLDNGAINRAFDFSGATAAKAFDFGNATTREAFDFGSQSLDFGKALATKAFDFGLESQAASSAALSRSTGLIADAYNDAKGRGALTDYILIGAIAMAGIVAYSAVKK